MSEAVPAAIRSLIRERAKGRCEYCCRHHVSQLDLTGSDRISCCASKDCVRMMCNLHENESTIYEEGQTRPNNGTRSTQPTMCDMLTGSGLRGRWNASLESSSTSSWLSIFNKDMEKVNTKYDGRKETKATGKSVDPIDEIK